MLQTLGIIYIAFSILHWELDVGTGGGSSSNREIYDALDWSDSLAAAITSIIVIIVVCPVALLVMWSWHGLWCNASHTSHPPVGTMEASGEGDVEMGRADFEAPGKKQDHDLVMP